MQIYNLRLVGSDSPARPMPSKGIAQPDLLTSRAEHGPLMALLCHWPFGRIYTLADITACARLMLITPKR